MNEDELKGKMKGAKGEAEEEVGEFLSDEEMQARGRKEKGEGKIQEAFGKAKDAFEDAKDKLTGED